MTDRKELEALIAKAESKGAVCIANHDQRGWISSVTVLNLKGVGPYPMGPIAFAERMREVLAA